MWHELKEFLRQKGKPSTKANPVKGIEQFWGIVTREKCRKYIRHLYKVMPQVIKLDGLLLDIELYCLLLSFLCVYMYVTMIYEVVSVCGM